MGICSRYAVRSRCWCKKVSSHSDLSKYGWLAPLPLVQKGQNPHSGYTVGTQYAVGMQYRVGTQYTVDMQYTVGTQYTVGINAKRSNSRSWVCSMQ